MLKKVYYYNFNDIAGDTPFQKYTMIALIKELLNEESLEGLIVPSDLASKSSIYDELASLVISRYREHAIIRITKYINEGEPTSEELAAAFKEWGYKFLSMLNLTHDYYITLLDNYNGAKAQLMADIKATSKNKVKFNDTPQNPNSAQVYEGDDYITHFTSTEGENSSPLMSKMMRLKEIQDNYRDLITEWVRDFERIYFQEDC